jgi:hypothetical protein
MVDARDKMANFIKRGTMHACVPSEQQHMQPDQVRR